MKLSAFLLLKLAYATNVYKNRINSRILFVKLDSKKNTSICFSSTYANFTGCKNECFNRRYLSY